MATTFNPNGYSRSEIEDALKGGMDYRDSKEEIATVLTNIQTNLSGLDDEVDNIGMTVEQNTAHIQLIYSEVGRVKNNIQTLFDLLSQIVYRGSDNKLQLDESNMTVEGTGLTATFSDGVLTITKETTIVGDDPYISFTGITIPAGSWYIGVPKDGDDVWYAELKDSNDNIMANTGSDDHSEKFTIAIDYTDCTLNIGVYKVAAFSEKKLIPYLSSVILNKDTSMPYFKSLIEVSNNE